VKPEGPIDGASGCASSPESPHRRQAPCRPATTKRGLWRSLLLNRPLLLGVLLPTALLVSLSLSTLFPSRLPPSPLHW